MYFYVKYYLQGSNTETVPFSETYILVAGGEEPIVYLDDNKVFQ